MATKVFGNNELNSLVEEARSNPRLRQHLNIHQDYQEPCQRLFNAIEPGSYVRPHRHASDPRDELLIVVRGLMGLITFDDLGEITGIIRLGTEKFANGYFCAVEVPASVWHTVVSLEPGSVLLEIKAGPFDPTRPKDLATWAPAESSSDATRYLDQLTQAINQQ